MAILPRYRRLGVQAQAPTRLDFSPMREQAALGQAISQNVDRMGDFIYREQVRRAEMAGQEAVREQGALPILERLAEQGGPGISIAEQSAYESANRVAVAEIQYEAENQISALLQQASDNNTPFSTVSTQLEDVVDGFSASLGYLNPEAAGLLQSRLRNSATDASRRYANAYRARARAASAQRRSEVATTFTNAALELARTEGTTPETIFSTLQENRQALIDGGMSESQAERWFNSAYSSAVRDNTLFRAMTGPLDDVRASIENPPTEPLPGMTYAETLTEYNRIGSIYNSRVAAFETDARALGSRMDTARSVLGSGGVVGPEQMSEILSEAERLDAISPGLMAEAERLQADAGFIDTVRGMNLPELEAALSAYSGGIPGVGEPGIDTPQEVYQRDVVARALTAAERAQAAARAEALEAADPDLRRIAAAGEVLDGVMSSPTPNPIVAEEAMGVLLSSYEALPDEIVTEDMRESMAEVQQTMQALQDWRESQPEELAAELDRLRTAIPRAEDLPEGVELIDQMAINQRQANLLSGFMAAQQGALADGNGLAYAQSQGMMIEDPTTGEPRVVGQPVNLSGDPASVRASLDQRFREVDYVEERFGVRSQSVLLPAEVAGLSATLSEALPSQQAQILGMIADLGQDRSMRIFDALGLESREARTFAHIGGLFAEGLPDVANRALRGLSLDAPPALSGQDAARRLRAFVGNAFAESPGTLEDLRIVANALYTDASYRTSGLTDTLSRSNYDDFLQQALGQHTIEQIGDQSVLLLPNVNVDAVEDFLRNPVDSAEVASAAIANPDSITGFNFEALDRGRWYPVFTRNGYMMRTGDPLTGATWTDDNNTPILLDLSILSSLDLSTERRGRGTR